MEVEIISGVLRFLMKWNLCYLVLVAFERGLLLLFVSDFQNSSGAQSKPTRMGTASKTARFDILPITETVRTCYI